MFKKYVSTILLLIVITLVFMLFIGCSANKQDFKWKTLKNKEHSFKIEYPDTWVVLEDTGSYAAVFRPSNETQTTFYVETYKSSFSDETQKSYVSKMMNKVMRIRSEFDFKEPVETDINGYDFTVLEYSTKVDSVMYYYKDCFTANGYGYMLRYVIVEEEYESVSDIMEQMIDSFEFTK